MLFTNIRKAELPEGTYKARINNILEKTSKNGVPYMVYCLTVFEENDSDGKDVSINVFTNSPFFPTFQNNVVSNYLPKGQERGTIDCSDHIGTIVEVDIGVKPTPDGDEYLVLNSYRPLDEDYPPESEEYNPNEIFDLNLDDD